MQFVHSEKNYANRYSFGIIYMASVANGTYDGHSAADFIAFLIDPNQDVPSVAVLTV